MDVAKTMMDRRVFTGAATAIAAAFALTGCSTKTADEARNSAALPAAEPDPENMFAVDRHVNMDTIDDYLGLEGVVYRDMRLVVDPARYEDIGGDSNLSLMLKGFTVVPMPWMGTLAPLPVSGAYSGERLYDIEWGDGIEIKSATPRFAQSLQIIEELFPKDKPIVLMCGGGGYAGMMRSLLIYLGWDASKLYNAGGMWDYLGSELIQLISYANPTAPEYYLWRAPLVNLDFSTLR